MRWRRLLAGAALCSALAAGSATAHHSFAVFFDQDKSVSITGVVTEFRFTNPHGVIQMTVGQGGKAEVWKVETNAPVLLRRRGWSKDSVKVGEKITIEGWPARDGSRYLRVRRALGPDGKPIGTAAVPSEER
jgi:hypothetical protein